MAECALLAIFFGIIVSMGFAYVRAWKKKLKTFDERIPGPRGVPILGNCLDLISIDDLLQSFRRLFSQYGKVWKGYILLQPYLFVADHKLMEAILNSGKCLQKSSLYTFVEPLSGQGLFSCRDTNKWKEQRKFLTPAFHLSILKNNVPVFDKCTQVLVDKIRRLPDKSSIEILHPVTLCALDIVSETVLGFKLNAQSTEDLPYFQHIAEEKRIIAERLTSFVPFVFTRNFYKQKKLVRALNRHTDDIIEARRAVPEEAKKSFKKSAILLDLLLQTAVHGMPLTDKEIREQVDTFTFAGHDTSALTLSFALYCLAENPEVQEKAFEEQREIFGHNGRDIQTTHDHIAKMKYLEQIIKETLRLFPPAPMVGRRVEEDILYDGIVIPKGVNIALCYYVTHMDPEYFPNPTKFDPSRFEEETYPFKFLAFSGGPRNCIGSKYATMELKCMLSKMLRNFRIVPTTPRHELQLVGQMTLTCLGGIRVGMEERVY